MGTRTKALMLKWSIKEGASNSTCSEEAHEIYALAEELEEKLAALEADARRYRWLRDKSRPNGVCPFYLSVVEAFKDTIFRPETVDAQIDSAALSQEPGGK